MFQCPCQGSTNQINHLNSSLSSICFCDSLYFLLIQFLIEKNLLTELVEAPFITWRETIITPSQREFWDLGSFTGGAGKSDLVVPKVSGVIFAFIWNWRKCKCWYIRSQQWSWTSLESSTDVSLPPWRFASTAEKGEICIGIKSPQRAMFSIRHGWSLYFVLILFGLNSLFVWCKSSTVPLKFLPTLW